MVVGQKPEDTASLIHRLRSATVEDAFRTPCVKLETSDVLCSWTEQEFLFPN